MTREAEIAAREKAAMPGPLTRDEIEERRRNLFFFFSEGGGDMKSLFDVRLGEMLAWLATFDDLLAELKDRDEKLAAVKELGKEAKRKLRRGRTVVSTVWLVDELDRILRGESE